LIEVVVCFSSCPVAERLSNLRLDRYRRLFHPFCPYHSEGGAWRKGSPPGSANSAKQHCQKHAKEDLIGQRNSLLPWIINKPGWLPGFVV